MKKGRFDVPIYEFKIEVVVVENKFKTTEFYHTLTKRFKKPSEGNEPCEGFVFLYGLKAWIVFAEDKLSNSLISHEMAHLAIRIMQFNNIKIEEAEENFCLLSGFMSDRTYKIINKLGCKII